VVYVILEWPEFLAGIIYLQVFDDLLHLERMIKEPRELFVFLMRTISDVTRVIGKQRATSSFVISMIKYVMERKRTRTRSLNL
jgi:hypothetical protein